MRDDVREGSRHHTRYSALESRCMSSITAVLEVLLGDEADGDVETFIMLLTKMKQQVERFLELEDCRDQVPDVLSNSVALGKWAGDG